MSEPRPALPRILPLALALLALAAALLVPARTLAQAHRATCSTPARAQGTRAARTCTKAARKATSRQADRRGAKRTRAKPRAKTRPGRAAHVLTTPARCEDASLPVRAADGTFSCDDGSEPDCEDGAAPALSRSGAKLVCVPTSAPPAGFAEAECAEEVEAEASCAAVPGCPQQAGEAAACEGEG